MSTTVTDTDGWKIPASAHLCARCENPLEVGDDVTVVLGFGEEGPTREDLCARCGQSVGDSGEVFWRHRLPESAAAPRVVDYALLREMFHKMLERTEPVYQRLSYLVGLVLVRKRSLRLRGFELRGGREVMVVTRGAGEPELEVPAPHLDAEAMLQTREHLKRLLAADLPSDDVEGGPDDLLDALPAMAEVPAAADEEGEAGREGAEGAEGDPDPEARARDEAEAEPPSGDAADEEPDARLN